MNSPRKKSPTATYVLIAVLALLAVLSGFNYFFKPFSNYSFVEEASSELPISQPSPVPEVTHSQKVTELVARLTPEEKIAQLIAVPFTVEDFLASVSATTSQQASAEPQPATSSAYVAFLSGAVPVAPAPEEPGLGLLARKWGFVTLFGSEVSTTQATQTSSYLDEINEAPLPIWIMVDHEGGTVQRLSGTGFTQLPSWQDQCALDPVELAALWKTSSTELSQVGIDVVLAPMVDRAQNHPVLGSRVCSATTQAVFEAAATVISATNEVGILPVLKHFPGIGATKRDLHNALDSVVVSQEDVELYKRLLAVYPYSAVMTGHAAVTNQDSTIPCSLSASCISELHTEYPLVLTISDALEMKATGVGTAGVQLEDVALKAAQAGNAVLLFGPGVSQSDLTIVHARLLREYETSYEFRELVNKHVQRIVDYKLAN